MVLLFVYNLYEFIVFLFINEEGNIYKMLIINEIYDYCFKS